MEFLKRHSAICTFAVAIVCAEAEIMHMLPTTWAATLGIRYNLQKLKSCALYKQINILNIYMSYNVKDGVVYDHLITL